MKLFKRNSLSAFWKDTSGITLVEVIVNFALMGMFMMAAVFVITTSLRLFDRMQSVSRAVMVSNVILDQIADELYDINELDRVDDLAENEIPDMMQDVISELMEKSRKPGSNVYLGFEIEYLTCLRPRPEECPEVFRIDLTLYLKRTGMRYETYRYVKILQNADNDEILEEDILEVWK